MLLAAPILMFAQRGAKVDAPVLDYHGGNFSVIVGKRVTEIPIDPDRVKPPESISFRRNDNYAVWDSRGLTVRRGNRSLTTRLDEASTSPRLFDHDTLVQVVSDIESGQKQRGASALSGSLRIGTNAYFLVRWDDRDQKPWMEALVRVSLDNENIKPEVVGRFAAMSVAYKPIGDRLLFVDSKIAVVGRKGQTWGLVSYDAETSVFDYRPLGDELLSYIQVDNQTGLFCEKSSYGTVVGGRIDLTTGTRRVLLESRGMARFIDAMVPGMMVATRDGESRIRNFESGAEATIPNGAGVARVGRLVLVWAPVTKPVSATLYDPERWTPLAAWAGQPPKASSHIISTPSGMAASLKSNRGE